MANEQRPRPSIGEGIRTGVGVLAALREAIEETVTEAMERSDLRPERARDAMNVAFERAQAAMDDVRERMDAVPRREFDALLAEVRELRARLDALEGRGSGPAGYLPGDVGSPGVFSGGQPGHEPA